MKGLARASLAVMAGLTLFGSFAGAKVAGPGPLSDRVARADAVLVGKVTRIEDKTVRNGDGVDLQVAVVEIKEGLSGTAKDTHVRVGFVPGPNRRFPHLNLQEGQESLFILAKQPGDNVYTFQMYFDVVDKKGPTFDTDLEATRKLAKAMEGAEAGLKAKGADERFLAAAMLVLKYRTPRAGQVKQVEVDAPTSKLILEALLGADWSDKAPADPLLTPVAIFRRLGVGPDDGFKFSPKDPTPIQAAAQAWLKANAGTYKVKRFAAEK